jgi:NAD-dependent dihydropyrimidine dehydrogenase PreA subunit
MFILGKGFTVIMRKKECKDGQCEANIPDLSIKFEIEKKVDKKDSSKRLR